MGLFDIFKISSNNFDIPKGCAYDSWTQDTNQSITTPDGLYDFKHLSQHEIDTINHVLNMVKSIYPLKYRSLGLANESHRIVYKPRYILFEIIIQLYGDSEKAIDKFAVALAYETKGAFFRKQAIDYFEASEPYFKPQRGIDYTSYAPLEIYHKFSKLYEQEHLYEKAIYYTKLAQKYSEPGNLYFINRINELSEKSHKEHKTRNRKMPAYQVELEKDITEATKQFANFFKD